MDLNQAARRILVRHWAVILLLVLVGIAVPLALHRMEEPSYQASARFTIGSWDTRDGQEAGALADTGLALATSRAVMERALEASGFERDLAQLAEAIQVAPVGSSGVLELTVVDAGPRAAAAIADALAEEVVLVRDEAVFGENRETIAALDERITALSAQIALAEEQAVAAAARLADVGPIALRHDELVAQRSQLVDERQQLIQTLATTAAPRIVDPAALYGTAQPSVLHIRLAIGALLGIILGVALAATLEAWRPTLTGPAIARHLGAPLLARLPRPPWNNLRVRSPWLANYLTLAADAVGVRSVQLVPVGSWVNVAGLAESLDDETVGPRVTALGLGRSGQDVHPPLRESGLVAVVPDVVKGTGPFEDLLRHAELTRQPIVGVITYRGRVRAADRRSATPHRPVPSAAGDRTAAPVGQPVR
jgi:capsular polysaccharide biosynthesis protein